MRKILNSDVIKLNGTCSQLTTFAFSIHQYCYTDYDFCTNILSSDTNLNFLASKVFNLNDFWNKQAIKQV